MYNQILELEKIEDTDTKIKQAAKLFNTTQKDITEELGYNYGVLAQYRRSKNGYAKKFIVALDMYIKIKKLEFELQTANDMCQYLRLKS